jgi:hypothetical protein
MSQHKWHKEICAWANGAEIEYHQRNTDEPWSPFDGRWTNSDTWEYRIKPTPKEPQYLYVYGYCEHDSVHITKEKIPNHKYPIGKIKLEE